MWKKYSACSMSIESVAPPRALPLARAGGVSWCLRSMNEVPMLQRSSPIGQSEGEASMRNRATICAIALATALLATPSVAQVVDFGKYPDLKGQWVRHQDGSPNNWIRLGGQPPLTP